MRIFSRPQALRAVVRLIIASSAIASLSACKSLTSVEASLANIADTSSVFALNGSPFGTPTAVNLFNTLFTRADQSFGYDVAFDITSDGKVAIIPVRALAAGSFANPYSVGLQIVPGTYDELTEAPRNGYVIDSVFTVAKGQTVAIESHDFVTCQFAIKGTSYFSKIQIVDIDPVQRRISLSFTVDRNCGFRSFSAGIPRD